MLETLRTTATRRPPTGRPDRLKMDLDASIPNHVFILWAIYCYCSAFSSSSAGYFLPTFIRHKSHSSGHRNRDSL